ncbi:hypothetical protein HMN09_00000700 [Mycena chlorophos]|uniref:PQ-loop-domain-containing protein n=1 Tax=Mycena chlorophos TaxID=658473 RepID=A0A8H6WRU9_MYCCL|nr:hypothetical protein HMN09_00000700 [Mycena chlorophos]
MPHIRRYAPRLWALADTPATRVEGRHGGRRRKSRRFVASSRQRPLLSSSLVARCSPQRPRGMPVSAAAQNVLGTLGTICWSVQMVPQIWKSYREKSTEGLSHWLVLIWGSTVAFFGPYTIIQNLNIPLILQPQLFGFLSFVSWGQCQYYSHPAYADPATRPHARRRAILLGGLAMLLVVAFQLALVFGIRPAYRRGDEPAERAVDFLGILSPVLISLALIPQYVEIYRLKEVVGISIAFMVVDGMGGVFSDLSLLFRGGPFDIVASITYTLVVVLDGAVILAALILNPRAEKRRRRAAVEDRIVTPRQSMAVAPVTLPVELRLAVRGPSGEWAVRTELAIGVLKDKEEELEPKVGNDGDGDGDAFHPAKGDSIV